MQRMVVNLSTPIIIISQTVLTCSAVPHIGNVYEFWTDNNDEGRATSSGPQRSVDKGTLLEEIVDRFLFASLGLSPAD